MTKLYNHTKRIRGYFNVMRSINSRFTYLLTFYLITCRSNKLVKCSCIEFEVRKMRNLVEPPQNLCRPPKFPYHQPQALVVSVLGIRISDGM